jgi:hypothetical protein
MRAYVTWILLALPLAGSVVLWAALFRRRRSELERVVRVFAAVLATAAPLYACGTFAYVSFVAPEPAFDYSFEHWGLLIALAGVVAGFIRDWPSRWYSWLAIGSSAWILILFFLASLTY